VREAPSEARFRNFEARFKNFEARFRENASKKAGIAFSEGESRFSFLSRASEDASGTHPPGSSFGASKRGGGEASGNPENLCNGSSGTLL
jgi:hypothetical protein